MRVSTRLLIFLLLSASLLATGHLATPDAHIRLWQTRMWIERGELGLPSDVGSPEQGNLAITEADERHSVYNPGQSLLFVPAVVLAHSAEHVWGVHHHYLAAWFASFLGPFSHAVATWLVFLVAGRLGYGSRRSLLVALVFGFATVSLPHATDGYEHPQETVALLGCVLFLLSPRLSASQSAASAGVVAGLGLLIRSSFLLALPGLLLLLRKPRAVLPFAAGLAPAVLALLAYNAARFHHPLANPYELAWAHAVPGPPEAGLFSTPIATGLYGLWLSPGKGLLLYAPVLLAGLVGLGRGIRRHDRFAWSAVAIVGAYSVFYAMNWAWHGSAWCWGPRYLVPVVPLLVLGMLRLPICRAPNRWALGLLIAVSVVIQIAALTVDYRRSLVETLVERPEAFESGAIFFDMRESPILGQLDAAWQIARHPARADLQLFVEDGPWRSVARPASQEQMLRQSVDFNAPNFWWSRLRYMPVDPWLVVWGHLLAGVLAFATLGTGVWLACGLRRS